MTTTTNPIEVLRELFATELRAVQFPGIDNDVLEAAAVRVNDAALEVERCEALLLAARHALQTAEDDELQRAQRALAYARIYAEDRPALLAQVHAIVLPSSAQKADLSEDASSAAPRRRGRPPKARQAGAPSLFAAESGSGPIEPIAPIAIGAPAPSAPVTPIPTSQLVTRTPQVVIDPR